MASWYYKTSDDVQGPFDASSLKNLAQTGELLPDSLVRKGEEGSWVSASHVKGLFQNEKTNVDLSSQTTEDDDQSTFRLQESTIPASKNNNKQVAQKKPESNLTSREQKSVASSDAEVAQKISSEYGLEAWQNIAAILLSPFKFYWTRREAIWLYFAATFSLASMKTRREKEIKIWQGEDQENVELPQLCVICGERTDNPLRDETKIAEELSRSFWFPMIGLAIALPVWFYSAWLSVLTIHLGIVAGHLIRRKWNIVVRVARCENHDTSTEFPSVRVFENAVYILVGSKKVKEAYMVGRPIEAEIRNYLVPFIPRICLSGFGILVPILLIITPQKSYGPVLILLLIDLLLLPLLLGSSRPIRITKSESGQIIIIRAKILAFLINLPTHKFVVTNYNTVEYLHIVGRLSPVRQLLLGFNLRTHFAFHKHYLQIHGEGQSPITLYKSSRRAVRQVAVMISDATGWPFVEHKKDVEMGVRKNVNIPSESQSLEV